MLQITLADIFINKSMTEFPPYPQNQAFTFVELLVTVVAMAILTALIIPAVQRSIHSAKGRACLINMRRCRDALFLSMPGLSVKCLALLLVVVLPVIAVAKDPEPTAKKNDSAYLVKDGKIQGRLFLPEKYGRAVTLATEELQRYFHKMTGDELLLSYRNPKPKLKNEIGIQLVVRTDEAWKGKESAQAFTIEQTSKPTSEFPLIGVTITGNTEMAVLYGVYEYLGELGVRWFSPGDIGENVPVLTEIAISAGRRAVSPSFRERGLDLSGTKNDHFDASDPIIYKDEIQYDYALWRLRNRLMFQRSINSGNWFDFNYVTDAGGHGLNSKVLGGVDFAKEPERFPMLAKRAKKDWAAIDYANEVGTSEAEKATVTKERQPKGGQICFTNEANVQRAIQKAVEYFENKAKTPTDFDELEDGFPMGLSDSDGICECEVCLEVGGDGPYSRDRLVWTFYNSVARGLDAQMPGKKIGLYAPYFELTRPPEGFKIEPNLVAVSVRGITWSDAPEDQPYYPFTKDHKANMEATGNAGAELRMATYTTWNGTPQFLSLLDAAEAYHALGIRTFHVEVMNRNEQMWPILWTLAQYAWNADQSTGDLLESYCREYYGENGGAVVLDLMKQIDANARKMSRIVYGGFDATQMIMTDELASLAEKSLPSAIEKAEGKEKKRLELFRDTLAMFATTARAYRNYCEALNQPTPEAIERFRQSVSNSEELWKDRNLQATCSPRVLARLRALSVPVEFVSAGRPELANDSIWREELFAKEQVPDTIPNLFRLPEIWKFQIDHNRVGLDKGWEKTGFNDQGWRTISTWNGFESQGNKDVDGQFWYRLKFTAPSFPDGKKVFLRIGSLDDDGDIYINGVLAHSRRFVKVDDWKTSFVFDATDFIKSGEDNVIAIRGNDAAGGGGLWRPTALYTN